MNDELKTPVIAPRNQLFLMIAFPTKIIYKQTENFKIDLQEPAHLFVDSIDLGMVRQCDFRVISDALSLYW